MVTRKTLLAKGLALALASYPQLIAAEGFSAAQVLDWEQKAQDALFQNSIAMTAIIASQKNDAGRYAACVSDWYGGQESQPARNEELRGHLARYPQHNPMAIILALLHNVCGKLFE